MVKGCHNQGNSNPSLFKLTESAMVSDLEYILFYQTKIIDQFYFMKNWFGKI